MLTVTSQYMKPSLVFMGFMTTVLVLLVYTPYFRNKVHAAGMTLIVQLVSCI